MNEASHTRLWSRLALGIFLSSMLVPTATFAQSDGLAVVIANSYDGFLPASLRDGEAIADKLEENGFDTVRLLGATGSEMAVAIEKIQQVAEGAGPIRLVYTTGFGMCLNDDLMLFAEDLQPEQFKSGQVGEVVVPLSVVAGAAAAGASQTLVVFDTNPRRCTSESIDAIKLPENAVLLITTGVGGDIVDEIDEDGMSAFATAFVAQYSSERPFQDVVSQVVTNIRELTEGQQQPILVGEF